MAETSDGSEYKTSSGKDVESESKKDAAERSAIPQSSNPIPQASIESHGQTNSEDKPRDNIHLENASNVPPSSSQSQVGQEQENAPPLPPRRPSNLQLLDEQPPAPKGGLQVPRTSPRPALQSKATTALSLTDIQTQSYGDGSRETYSTPNAKDTSAQSAKGYGSGRFSSRAGSGSEDTASVRSYGPTLESAGDVESLLGEVLGSEHQSVAQNMIGARMGTANTFDAPMIEDNDFEESFSHEFEELEEIKQDGSNEEVVLKSWQSRLKHFIILSAAGKPIYSRHGDDNLISNYVGIIQTIISFYQGGSDPLKAFTAGSVRFVILTEGPLYLVAISRLGESDSQLRAQLSALYMQILSTLTLPNLTHIFSNRPSTDLRRPLQGTEPLLSSLADSFTRGSTSTLLNALEALKLRKSQRQVINSTLLKCRTESLLYGLIVAGGRLVSVVRPKKHSLHPSDLQLIFNMLFEAEGVRAGGGENWIPLCLPGFNNRGYLYMYVSFLSALEDNANNGDSNAYGQEDHDQDRPTSSSKREDEVAVLLISPKKESFFELKKMRDDVVQQLAQNGSLEIIKRAVRHGRPTATDIVPGTVLRHFLYKSRANVQFAMPAFAPHFDTTLSRRKLHTLYSTLSSSLHTKTSHLKVAHTVSRDSISLAWLTPIFELYAVAGPNTTRNALAQGANKVVQWVKREEERVFILDGAVF
ncbi:MAG: hypothetical protein M1819_002689 [Sarea resinae]|nr:MAG: hypothetical protein M1819_002689 [Sarea resinae]